MIPLVPEERLVHRGHIAIAGLYYAGREEAWARQDILDRYTPGTRVFRHEGILLVLFAGAARVPVNECPGIPLVRQAGFLTALPLHEPEETSKGWRLSLAKGGEIKLHDLEHSDEEDPASWLVLQNYAVEEGCCLRRPPLPPQMVVEEGAKDVREVLDGAIPDPHPEAKATLQALNRAGGGSASRRVAGGGSGLGAVLLGMGRGLITGLGLITRLSRVFGRASSGLPRLTDGSSAPARKVPPPAPGLFRRVASGFKALLWRSKLGSWLGREHAKYLGDLFDLLESGSYDEALRRAIPTGGNGALTGLEEPPLLPFGRRDHLTLGEQTGSGSTLGLGENLYAQLRAAYRQAFRALDRQERFHEAAFVLSELLQENEEAVTYLESKGLIEQAAKLAEARELAPGLIVRLWFRAGQRQRALALARRDGAFEDALTRLKAFPDEAKSFRLEWAETLAEAGNYAGAVEVARHVPEAKALCNRWLDLAVEQGGVAGARALVLMCQLRTEEFEALRQHALQLLGNQDRFDSRSLDEMGRRLLASREHNRAEAALARCLVRALLRDRGLGLNGIDQRRLKDLARISGDGALIADLPQIPRLDSLPRLENGREVIKLHLSATDVGVTSVHDAVLLSSGRYLVAKGDGGAFLYNRSQKLLHHFDVPAEKLIISDDRDRIIALARCGELSSVSQIDVARRLAKRWDDLFIDEFANTFDGDRWYVSMGSFVHALDVMNSSQRSLWRSGDTESNIVSIARAKGKMLLATGNGECWEHDEAPYRLRRRVQSRGLPVLGGATHDAWLGSGEIGVLPDAIASTPEDEKEFPDDIDDQDDELNGPDSEEDDEEYDDDDEGDEEYEVEHKTTPLSLGIFRDSGHGVIFGRADRVRDARVEDANDTWIVASYCLRPGTKTVLLIDRVELEPHIELHLDETSQVSARLGPDDLIVADSRGRILGFELGAGTQLINHRV